MIKFNDNRENRPQLVPGVYTGELVKIEYHPTDEETAEGKIPEFGPYLTFVYKVTEPAEFANAFRSGICSAKRNPKSKLSQWLRAMGVDLATMGDALDESVLIGKQVKMKLENDKSDRLKIMSIWPVGGTQPVPQDAPVSFRPANRPATLGKPAGLGSVVGGLVSRPVVQPPVVKPAPVQVDLGADDIPF